MHTSVCVCVWLTVDSSVLLYTHKPDTGYLTHFDSSNPHYSMPLICLPPPFSPLSYSHASAPPPALPSIPCDRYSPPPFSLLHTHTPRCTHTQTRTQINRHRNIIHSHTHCAVVKELTHSHKYSHTCPHLHTYTHLSCDVCCAMGSRWVESQCWLSLHWAPQGVFIVAKNQQSRSHEVLSRSHTQTRAHTYIRGYVCTYDQKYSRTYWQYTKKA